MILIVLLQLLKYYLLFGIEASKVIKQKQYVRNNVSTYVVSHRWVNKIAGDGGRNIFMDNKCHHGYASLKAMECISLS